MSLPALVDRLLVMVARIPSHEEHGCLDMATPPRPIDRQAILSSFDNYLDALHSIFTPDGVEEAIEILKRVAEEGELRSQEITDRLDLSQSATLRRLKQLSATGYLSARRCAGAKCYRLHEERLEDTFRAISAFLLGLALRNANR